VKRAFAILLALSLLLSLCACGKKKKEAESAGPAPAALTPVPNEPFEVKISMGNLFDYFDYKEYRADVRDENSSEIDSSTIAYGLQLKPQYAGANDPKHRDTMELTFTADGLVMSGDFQINFDDLSFTGTPATSERVHVVEKLHFWAKGDRTTTWAFGNYSNSNIMYFESFRITDARGSIWLKRAEPKPTPPQG